MTTQPLRTANPQIGPDRELARAWHPGQPVGKGRPRIDTRGARPRTFTPKQTVQAERALGQTLRVEWMKPPTQGPVALELLFAMRERSGKPPDLDNLVKLVLDAANGILYADDTQVVEVHARRIVAPVRESVGTLVVLGTT